MIPSPRFVVFYNGTDSQPERQTLRLSDSYEKEQENPELELTVTMYNINPGYNEEIMDACRTLKEYAMYVEQVRNYAKQMPLKEAVERAVDYCIEAGILSEFLRKNRAEAIKVSIYEYDEELHHKTLYEEGVRRGLLRVKPVWRSCCKHSWMRAEVKMCAAPFLIRSIGNNYILRMHRKYVKVGIPKVVK